MPRPPRRAPSASPRNSRQRREQSSTYDDDSLARRAHINQLKADIKSLEEGVKRLQGGALDKAPAGDRVKSFRGRGERKYISALQMKGKRILILLDTSASMMDEDVAKVIKLRNQPEPMRARPRRSGGARSTSSSGSPRSCPTTASSRCIGYNTKAKPVHGEHAGQWLGNERSARHQQRADRGAHHHARRRHQPGQCVPVGAHDASASPTRSS